LADSNEFKTNAANSSGFILTMWASINRLFGLALNHRQNSAAPLKN
jgi:hypothetical protein